MPNSRPWGAGFESRVERLAGSEHATGQAYQREPGPLLRVPVNLEDNPASVLQKKSIIKNMHEALGNMQAMVGWLLYKPSAWTSFLEACGAHLVMQGCSRALELQVDRRRGARMVVNSGGGVSPVHLTGGEGEEVVRSCQGGCREKGRGSAHRRARRRR